PPELSLSVWDLNERRGLPESHESVHRYGTLAVPRRSCGLNMRIRDAARRSDRASASYRGRAASRCRIAICRGNSPQDRSSSTTSRKKNIGRSRSSHRTDSSHIRNRFRPRDQTSGSDLRRESPGSDLRRESHGSPHGSRCRCGIRQPRQNRRHESRHRVEPTAATAVETPATAMEPTAPAILYYPGHRQVPAALRALIDMIRTTRGWTPAKGLVENPFTADRAS